MCAMNKCHPESLLRKLPDDGITLSQFIYPNHGFSGFNKRSSIAIIFSLVNDTNSLSYHHDNRMVDTKYTILEMSIEDHKIVAHSLKGNKNDVPAVLITYSRVGNIWFLLLE